MNSRLFLFLCASTVIGLPGTAWAGSGGPNGIVVYGGLVIIILMLAAILKKLY